MKNLIQETLTALFTDRGVEINSAATMLLGREAEVMYHPFQPTTRSEIEHHFSVRIVATSCITSKMAFDAVLEKSIKEVTGETLVDPEWWTAKASVDWVIHFLSEELIDTSGEAEEVPTPMFTILEAYVPECDSDDITTSATITDAVEHLADISNMNPYHGMIMLMRGDKEHTLSCSLDVATKISYIQDDSDDIMTFRNRIDIPISSSDTEIQKMGQELLADTVRDAEGDIAMCQQYHRCQYVQGKVVPDGVKPHKRHLKIA